MVTLWLWLGYTNSDELCRTWTNWKETDIVTIIEGSHLARTDFEVWKTKHLKHSFFFFLHSQFSKEIYKLNNDALGTAEGRSCSVIGVSFTENTVVRTSFIRNRSGRIRESSREHVPIEQYVSVESWKPSRSRVSLLCFTSRNVSATFVKFNASNAFPGDKDARSIVDSWSQLCPERTSSGAGFVFTYVWHGKSAVTFYFYTFDFFFSKSWRLDAHESRDFGSTNICATNMTTGNFGLRGFMTTNRVSYSRKKKKKKGMQTFTISIW